MDFADILALDGFEKLMCKSVLSSCAQLADLVTDCYDATRTLAITRKYFVSVCSGYLKTLSTECALRLIRPARHAVFSVHHHKLQFLMLRKWSDARGLEIGLGFPGK